jgi:hypothetical protein
VPRREKAIMPGDASGPATEITRAADGLRQAIGSGAIAPGERIRVGSPGWPCGLSGTTARSALAIIRRDGLAYWHRHEYYAAPAGPPQPAATALLARVLAGTRDLLGLSVPGLAARIVDGNGPWGPGGREHMISLRVADITAAENGTWQPRRAWQHIDAAMRAGGTLLRVHDDLYTRRHSSPARSNSPEGKNAMTPTRCSCGFQRLDDEEVTDHLLAAFEPGDSTGNDGQVHQELAGLNCSCGFTPTAAQELDIHFLAVFTPAGSADRDGVKHEPAA